MTFIKHTADIQYYMKDGEQNGHKDKTLQNVCIDIVELSITGKWLFVNICVEFELFSCLQYTQFNQKN